MPAEMRSRYTFMEREAQLLVEEASFLRKSPAELSRALADLSRQVAAAESVGLRARLVASGLAVVAAVTLLVVVLWMAGAQP